MVKPRDDKQAAQDLARDLADISGHFASLKGEANAWLRDPNYDTLKLRLENAHAALEAATVEAPGGGYKAQRGAIALGKYRRRSGGH